MIALEKLSTGIPSLDRILQGGLPRNSVNVIAGPPGTGKSILAQQMVFHNARADARAPYLATVSEPTVKMLRYNQRFASSMPSASARTSSIWIWEASCCRAVWTRSPIRSRNTSPWVCDYLIAPVSLSYRLHPISESDMHQNAKLRNSMAYVPHRRKDV